LVPFIERFVEFKTEVNNCLSSGLNCVGGFHSHGFVGGEAGVTKVFVRIVAIRSDNPGGGTDDRPPLRLEVFREGDTSKAV